MSNVKTADLIVIGGGVVGAAIAYGACQKGCEVIMLDEGDLAFRAARGNFGLVWVQGKGANCPDYASWSWRSANLWPEFARQLEATANCDVQLVQKGGLHLCLSPQELSGLAANMAQVRDASRYPYPYDVLDHKGVQAHCAAVGPEVVGGIYCPLDGHVSPLYLLRALFSAVSALGGSIISGAGVHSINKVNDTFCVTTATGTYIAKRVVLAAGLGNAKLAPLVGLTAPVRPIRGQVMVTERVDRFLELPTLHVRQTGDGSIQIGDSKEDVGFDDGTSFEQLQRIADRAVRCFPALAKVNMIRAWGALRVMTADGFPIYEESATCPGAFVVSCHSGISLAAVHAGEITDWILGGNSPAEIGSFKLERFNVCAY